MPVMMERGVFVHAWETDLKKKIACVRWIMPTGTVCACMHEGKLMVQL